MGIIHVLDENTANKIAAGEVVERPASVVKELVENSIDAHSTSITVEIRDGGISYIRVADNGDGMGFADAKTSFIRHATSKISNEKDLNHIKTLGFRGEALASIASVAQVEMLTKPSAETFGTRIAISGGELITAQSCGCPDGTAIIVENLFYNTPARLKFLKKESREGAIISEVMYSLALSKPDISFKFINNGKLIFNTSGDGDLKNTALTLYGREVYDSLISVSHAGNILSVSGFIGTPETARSNRNYQMFFVNNRYIKNKMLSAAVDNAYKTYLMVNKFAFCILFISICPELVDVNVHPTKAEVRFQDDKEVFSAIFNTVRNGLAGEVLIPDSHEKEDERKYIKPEQVTMPHLGFETPLKYNEEVRENVFTSMPGSIPHETKEYAPVSDLVIEDKPQIFEGTAKNLLPPLVVIGQCSMTYILSQGPDGLYIIDQHAAHERVLYEKFKASYEKGSIVSQGLLAPLVIELVPKEINLIKDNSDIISKLGFEFDFFGNNSVILRSVPFIFGEPRLKKMFIELIDLLDSNDASGRTIIDRMIYTMACKSAIKANDRLSMREMEELIADMRKTSNPYNCPHGRPTIIKLTDRELEKKFKRIQ